MIIGRGRGRGRGGFGSFGRGRGRGGYHPYDNPNNHNNPSYHSPDSLGKLDKKTVASSALYCNICQWVILIALITIISNHDNPANPDHWTI